MRGYKKYFTLLAVGLLLMAPCSAQTTLQLVVERQNGMDVTFFIHYDKPVVTFDKAKLVVKAEKENFEAAISQVKRFSFKDVPDKMESTMKPSIDFQKVGEDKYEIVGLESVDDLQVLTTTGKVVRKGVAYSNGRLLVELSGLATGVYLIKIGNIQTIKILKK